MSNSLIFVLDQRKKLLSKIWENSIFEYGLLAAVTLLAAALRFYKLGQWGLWIDEIFTINHAQMHYSSLESVLQNFPQSPWLPVSVILTEGSLKIFGVSEWSARLASVLIGVLTLPILYYFTRKLFGPVAALFFAVLLAVSPWHLFWSQNARFYTSLLLFYTLASFAFFTGLEQNRPKDLLAFYLFLYLAASERLVTIFILPVIAIYIGAIWLLPFEKPAGFVRRNLLILIAPLLLVAVIEVIYYLVTGSSTLADAIDTFGGQPFDNPPRLFVAIGFNISFPMIAFALVSALYFVNQKSRAGLFFLLSAVVPVVLLVALNPFMFTKDRYVFMTLPSWLILVAIGIQEILNQTKGRSKLLAAGVLLVLVAEAAGTNLLYYHVNNGNRRDWRAAFEMIKENSRADDQVVAWWPQFGPFYLQREILPWKDLRPEDILEDGGRFWFVLDSETIRGNPKTMDWVLKHAELMNIYYLRMPEDDFNLTLYLYDPARDLDKY